MGAQGSNTAEISHSFLFLFFSSLLNLLFCEEGNYQGYANFIYLFIFNLTGKNKAKQMDLI